MTTRSLGNSDLHITSVGFGAWAIGGPGYEFAWGQQDDNDSIAAIHRALELGVNWIDTAPVYGMGHSEEVVARALQSWKGARPYVFTKCVLRWDKAGKINQDFSVASLRQECEDSLRRLQVETIDLYQMHWPPSDGSQEKLAEAWGTLAALKAEGRVRWIGVSNFKAEQLQFASTIAPITSLQPPYSIIRRAIEDSVLPECEKQGIGVISYAPMASGLLTGAMTRERAVALPADDFRSRNSEFREPRLSKNIELVERLRKVGERHGALPGAVAIAWALRKPVITGAIVGARNAQQAEGVMRAGELKLSQDEIKEIEGAAAVATAR
jgi:aryl-alcohol dehydrogenase-like predicted oxidoreductase